MTQKKNRLFGKPIADAWCFARQSSGAAAVEFALLAPVLFLLLIGTFQFGILINNYIQVTEATRVGGRTLAISRGSSTPVTSTKSAVYASAPSLTQGDFGFTFTIDGSACSTDSACQTALTNNQGDQATLTVAYNCGSLIVYGTNFFPSCTLTSTTSMRIE